MEYQGNALKKSRLIPAIKLAFAVICICLFILAVMLLFVRGLDKMAEKKASWEKYYAVADIDPTPIKYARKYMTGGAPDWYVPISQIEYK